MILVVLPNFSFLCELEVTFPGWVGGVGGWLDTDNKTISVQLNLTRTATGTELGNRNGIGSHGISGRLAGG